MIILSILLIVFFTFASSIKIFGWQKFIFNMQLSFFKKYGLNRMQMLLVGLIELSSAALLSVSLFIDNNLINAFGSVLIALTSLGAIYFHLKFDTFRDAIPAWITLTLSSILILNNNYLINLIP